MGIKFEYNKYKNQIDIIPCLEIYIHSHGWSKKEYDRSPWHFHICITWIFWYVELQIGKDYAD